MTANSVSTKKALMRGESQWELIWREFRKRHLAVVAAVVLLILITASIFAPFLANDRPIFYYGFNRSEYQDAARTSRSMITQLIAARQKDAERESVRRPLQILHRQLELMSRSLPVATAQQLEQLEKKIQDASSASDKSSSISDLQRLNAELREKFDAKKVELSSKTHWPVLASLSGLDAAFLAANLVLLLLPGGVWLMRRTLPFRLEWIRQPLILFAQFVLPVIAGVAWWWAIPSRVDITNYKAGVLAADEQAGKAPVVYESVLWPPIVYAIDEVATQDGKLPPAWYPAWMLPPDAKTPGKPASNWSGPHWLGTDPNGKDLLCLMIWGGRVSLSVGLVAVGIYVAIGIVLGAIAGYFRGYWDLIISRLIEIMICFPTFFLILTIVAFFNRSLFNIMLIIGLTGWTGIARLVRSEFLRLVNQEFVLAGRAMGFSAPRIIFRHLLPNALAPVLVAATFGISGAILTESALSFLGLGVSKPTPSWGALLYDGRSALESAPWLIHFPGLAIFLTITSYNLIGEALRDAADPRLRGSR